MDPKFLSAAYGIPPVVLGKQLKPFCCGHAQSLYAVQSPFMQGGKINNVELITAVWICSMTSEEGRKNLLSDWDNTLKEVLKWGGEVKNYDFMSELNTFDKYLTDYTRSPDSWKRGESREAKSPWALRIVIMLMRELKISQSEAENMPLPMALWYIATINDLNGDSSLISEQEKERIRIAKEMAVNHG